MNSPIFKRCLRNEAKNLGLNIEDYPVDDDQEARVVAEIMEKEMQESSDEEGPGE